MLAAHYRVSGMNFIPGGYAVPGAVQDAQVEAESQLIASASVNTDMQPPSPNLDNKWHDNNEDEEEPSTPPKDVYLGNPDQSAMCPPQLQTLSKSNPITLPVRKSKSLQVYTQKPPPSEEVV